MTLVALETLVKLAAAGTSGVCIACVAASGYILLKLPNDAPPAKHSTLKTFMIVALCIAIVSAVTTGLAGYWDYRTKAVLRSENQQLTATTEAQANTIEESAQIANALNVQLSESQEAIASLTQQTKQLSAEPTVSQKQIAALKAEAEQARAATAEIESQFERLREALPASRP